jgi:hypothetical protein
MPSSALRGDLRTSGRTLVLLIRRTLARSWGIRAARIYAGLLCAGFIVAIAVSAGGLGANATSLSLVARGAAMLVWIPGAACALALSTPVKDVSLAQGIAALAAARGFDPLRVARAEALATMRLVGEVIVVPLVVMTVFVLSIAARGAIAQTARPLAGWLVFGTIAAATLGVVASLCRSWGGARGRTWLTAVVLGPWFFAEIALSGRTAPYVSIPGLLSRLWETLAAVST